MKFGICLFALIAASAAFYFLTVAGRRDVTDVGVRKLADLPFRSLDAQAAEEQLGLGKADAIITRLCKLSGISVLPTTAVFRYSGRDQEPMTAARELGVDAVLDGTMRWSGAASV